MPLRAEESFVQRAATLSDAEIFNQRETLKDELDHVRAKFHGYLDTGGYYRCISQMLSTELQTRAEIIWRNLVRAHKSFGAEYTGTLRDDMKRACEVQIKTSYDELQSIIDSEIKTPSDRPRFSLDNKLKNALRQYVEEIDMYFDDLKRNQARESGTTSAGPTRQRDQPSIVRREARKLETKKRHQAWQKAYKDLKSKHPCKTDGWYATKIADQDIADGRAAETIRKNMKR